MSNIWESIDELLDDNEISSPINCDSNGSYLNDKLFNDDEELDQDELLGIIEDEEDLNKSTSHEPFKENEQEIEHGDNEPQKEEASSYDKELHIDLKNEHLESNENNNNNIIKDDSKKNLEELKDLTENLENNNSFHVEQLEEEEEQQQDEVAITYLNEIDVANNEAENLASNGILNSNDLKKVEKKDENLVNSIQIETAPKRIEIKKNQKELILNEDKKNHYHHREDDEDEEDEEFKQSRGRSNHWSERQSRNKKDLNVQVNQESRHKNYLTSNKSKSYNHNSNKNGNSQHIPKRQGNYSDSNNYKTKTNLKRNSKNYSGTSLLPLPLEFQNMSAKIKQQNVPVQIATSTPLMSLNLNSDMTHKPKLDTGSVIPPISLNQSQLNSFLQPSSFLNNNNNNNNHHHQQQHYVQEQNSSLQMQSPSFLNNSSAPFFSMNVLPYQQNINNPSFDNNQLHHSLSTHNIQYQHKPIGNVNFPTHHSSFITNSFANSNENFNMMTNFNSDLVNTNKYPPNFMGPQYNNNNNNNNNVNYSKSFLPHQAQFNQYNDNLQQQKNLQHQPIINNQMNQNGLLPFPNLTKQSTQMQSQFNPNHSQQLHQQNFMGQVVPTFLNFQPLNAFPGSQGNLIQNDNFKNNIVNSPPSSLINTISNSTMLPKPNSVYINPSFIAKQNTKPRLDIKNGSEVGSSEIKDTHKQDVLKEMTYQHNKQPKSNEFSNDVTIKSNNQEKNQQQLQQISKQQRSKKDLELLLEKRLAAELQNENEESKKQNRKLQDSTTTSTTSSSMKRKSNESIISSSSKQSQSYSRSKPKSSEQPPIKKLMSKLSNSSLKNNKNVELASENTSSIPVNNAVNVIVIDDPDYSKKIEEQKKKREQLLKLKEEKRNQRILEMKKTDSTINGNTITIVRKDFKETIESKPLITKTEPIVQNRRIVTTNSSRIDQIGKSVSTCSSSSSVLKRLIIQNLSLNTTEKNLHNMCRSINLKDKLLKIEMHKNNLNEAELCFIDRESAEKFLKKFNRTLVDLSMITMKIV